MAKALLVVDMLNDFVKSDGNYCGKLVVPGASGLVEGIAGLVKCARENGVVVAYANDAHSSNDPEFNSWPQHAVEGTYGAEVIEGLAPKDSDLIFKKQHLSVFTNKSADIILKERGVDEIYVVGVATEYCVKSAVLDGLKNGYSLNVVVDAIAGVDEIRLPGGTSVPETKGAVARALVEMGNAGAKAVYAKRALEDFVR